MIGPFRGGRTRAAAGVPAQPNVFYVGAVNGGVWKTDDYGRTWTPIFDDQPTQSIGAIAVAPSDPNVIYVGSGEGLHRPDLSVGDGIYKSIDAGKTWTHLGSAREGLRDGQQIPALAVDPRDPNRVFAAVLGHPYGPSAERGIYRSLDGGQFWQRVISKDENTGGSDVQLDPANPDIVYASMWEAREGPWEDNNEVNGSHGGLFKSTDGGGTWHALTNGLPRDGGDDYQNLWINPNDGRIILLVSDQGALVTVNGGATWSSWYNQPTAQIYHVSVSNTFPYKVCGGQQESGSVCINSRGNDGAITFRDWHPVGVIEYGYVAPDPLDADVVYGGGRSEVSKFHWSTGQVQDVTPIPLRTPQFRSNRTEPLMFSPVDPHILYYATNVLFKSTDGGNSWQTISSDLTRENPGVPASVGTLVPNGADKQRGVIYSLAPSLKSVNTLWAGTDDGLVWITQDAGKSWKDITPRDLTPWNKVTQISASHFDDQSAYVSVSRFRINDVHPYIYRTHDGGNSWKLITAGLPDFGPADTVREDPMRKGLLFAGTENSVWVSFDDGDHWQSLQLNLPHTSMRDLWIHENDLIVATHGRSFWILDDIAPLREAAGSLTQPLAKTEAHLFTPAPAYRAPRDTNTDTPLPPDEPAAANPPDGAVIDFYLPRGASGPVNLEILDAKGQLIRRYSSTDQPEVSEADLKKQLIPLYWLRTPRILPTTSGMHRWVWDLQYPPPTSARHDYPIAAIPHDTPRFPPGPTVLPGEYTVRLTANGKSYTAPLTVKMDPRVKTSPASLERKFAVETKLASIVSLTSAAVLQAGSLRDQLQKLAEQSDAAHKDAIENFQKKLAEILGASSGTSAPPPDQVTLSRVNAQAGTLYAQIWPTDAEPTSSQMEARAVTERGSETVIKRWDTFKATDLLELNRELRDAQLPEIRLQLNPHQEESQTDEE